MVGKLSHMTRMVLNHALGLPHQAFALVFLRERTDLHPGTVEFNLHKLTDVRSDETDERAVERQRLGVAVFGDLLISTVA